MGELAKLPASEQSEARISLTVSPSMFNMLKNSHIYLPSANEMRNSTDIMTAEDIPFTERQNKASNVQNRETDRRSELIFEARKYVLPL